jgi:hypothetical protein
MQLLESQAHRIEDLEDLLLDRSESTERSESSANSHVARDTVQDIPVPSSDSWHEVEHVTNVSADGSASMPRSQRVEEELRLVSLQLEALTQENAWLKVGSRATLLVCLLIHRFRGYAI